VACSCLSAAFTCGAYVSCGESFRNFLNAATATNGSPADWAAWPSWSCALASFGVTLTSFT